MAHGKFETELASLQMQNPGINLYKPEDPEYETVKKTYIISPANLQSSPVPRMPMMSRRWCVYASTRASTSLSGQAGITAWDVLLPKMPF